MRPPERATATDGQVVLNLTVNVIESMSAVEPRYRKLRLSSEHVERGDISRSILDAGPGIDPDHLNEIFKPLFTIKPQGMGMGLSICRSIVDANGGRLWASPRSPRGAVFQFTVPTAGKTGS